MVTWQETSWASTIQIFTKTWAALQKRCRAFIRDESIYFACNQNVLRQGKKKLTTVIEGSEGSIEFIDTSGCWNCCYAHYASVAEKWSQNEENQNRNKRKAHEITWLFATRNKQRLHAKFKAMSSKIYSSLVFFFKFCIKICFQFAAQSNKFSIRFKL